MKYSYKKIFYVVVIFIFIFFALPSLAEDLALNEKNNIVANQPEYQITINDGQIATSNILAMLKFKFPVTVKSISISEYEDFRVAYGFGPRNFFLHTLSEEPGLKTIYARFLDENNVWLGESKSTIELLKPEKAIEQKIAPEVKGVKIFKTEADRMAYLKEEAGIISGGNIKELLTLTGQKRNLKSETAVVKKYYSVLKSKYKLSIRQIFIILNFINYGTPSTISLDAPKRADRVFAFGKKYKKLPVKAAEWIVVLK